MVIIINICTQSRDANIRSNGLIREGECSGGIDFL